MFGAVIITLIALQTAVRNPESVLTPSRARDIITLRDERAQLEAQRDALGLALQESNQKLIDSRARDQVIKQLANMKASDPYRPKLQDQLQYYDSRGPWDDSTKPDALVAKIKEIKQQQLDTEKRLGDNIRETYRATTIETERQDFLNRVSWIFGGLVAILVLGFFWVVGTDTTVRRSVFQGPAGLQMITLLSVVIAIILFGITGVLEGKELSALLGSLTGYILGRVADRAQTSGTPPNVLAVSPGPAGGGSPPTPEGSQSAKSPAESPGQVRASAPASEAIPMDAAGELTT